MSGRRRPAWTAASGRRTTTGTRRTLDDGRHDDASPDRRSDADPANPVIAPKSGEVGYILAFKGTISTADSDSGWEKRYPIVDGRGTEYAPVLAGTPDASGKLTQGTPQGILVLAYLVPAGAQGLSLKDGAAKHPLGR